VTLESQTYTAAGAAGDNAQADPEQQQKQPGGRRAKRGATRRGGPLKALGRRGCRS